MTTRCFRKRPADRWVTPEGYLFVALALMASVLSLKIFGWVPFFLFSLLTLYIALFFRNPRREIPLEKGLIVSPADGKVLEIVLCEEPRYLKAKAKRLSIFMSPFNCHLNRAPVAGKVAGCFYKPGSFAAAFKPKAMERNEHHAVLLEDERGSRWMVVQVAGWLARRIVSYVQEGDQLSRGEKFGLIQFGSRSDLYCPLETEFFVKPGDKVYAGKTVLGRVV